VFLAVLCALYSLKCFIAVLCVIIVLCCHAEELEKVVNCLKLSQDSESNDDMFNAIISLLECEGKSQNLLLTHSFCLAGTFFQSHSRLGRSPKVNFFWKLLWQYSCVLDALPVAQPTASKH